jgi:hypothetical protein
VIISAEEINEALRLVPPVKIKRLDGRAELVPTTIRAENWITEADIKIAATDYNDYVSRQIEKLRGENSR